MKLNTSLQKIFSEIPVSFQVKNIPDIQITGISIDSRTVKPGDLFVAMQGGTLDGHNYIQKAIDNGAVAILIERDVEQISDVPYIKIKNTRQALTWIAASFYNQPGHSLTVIGVTGTDGKTTTSNIIYKILIAAGIKAGMISTVNAVIGDKVLDTGFHVTTPDAHDVQKYLAQMVEAGLTHVVLETTSHAWAQYRVDACEFDIAVVTNITHEHMDEHGSYENYRAAKARLFESLTWTKEKKQGNPRLAVINRDDEKSFHFLNEFIEVNKINYGLNENADVCSENIEYKPSGIQFDVILNNLRVAKLGLQGKEEKQEKKEVIEKIKVTSKLFGTYNVYNTLAAFTTAVYGLGIKPEIVAQGIASLDGISGRMERIDMGQNFTAIVDFAHTPNALKSALEAGREMSQGRIISVFGSAGLRDKEKRRMMAEIGAQLADYVILTAEDPRTESLNQILQEMESGIPLEKRSEGKFYWKIADRGEAIKFAINLAREGDVVLACGKGHEQSMCFGKTEFLWDDRIAMRSALAELLNLEVLQKQYLPTQDKTEEEWLQT